MKWWWKLLGLTLILGASISALVTPLSSALVHCSPGRLVAGDQVLHVLGYNTHFNPGISVFLSDPTGALCATEVKVHDATHLSATFSVPPNTGGATADLIVEGSADGELILHAAVWTGDGTLTLPEVPCTGEVLTVASTAFTFPNRSVLYETIRNLNFHVPMWFTMMLLQVVAVVFSVRVLRGNEKLNDIRAVQAVNVSLFFATLGLITGSIWARATWGAWWTNDTKLNGAAVTTLIYLAYLVLRGSVPDPGKRARLAAIYNIFAFMLMLVFIMVLPRLTDSLHPGNGGNPAFSQYDLDDNLRMVFYPAVLGWMLIGIWLFTLRVRLAALVSLADAPDRT